MVIRSSATTIGQPTKWLGRVVAGLAATVTVAAGGGITTSAHAGTAHAVAGHGGAARAAAAQAGTVRTAAQPLRVMPLGDSITAGVGSATKSSYRTDLWNRLRDAGFPVDFVGSQTAPTGPDRQHEGHGGWTIDRIASHVEDWLAAYQPDVVLLHIGTNNVTRRQDPADIAAELSALIDQIRTARPTAYIFVSRIVGTKVRTEQARNRAYNARIPGVLADKGPMVRLVDQSRVAGIDLIDKHHPNDFGYAKMAHILYRALEGVFGTAGSWPAGTDPFTQRAAYLCFWQKVERYGRQTSFTECLWWQLRTVTRTVDSVPTEVDRWQTRRWTTERYTTVVDGRQVPATRRVLRWHGAEKFLTM